MEDLKKKFYVDSHLDEVSYRWCQALFTNDFTYCPIN